MANWLAGGSCFAPTMNGLNVPIELSLAIHSDAGVANDYSSIIGTLAISTTFHNDGIFYSGLSRSNSKKFAGMLLDDVNKDIKSQYKNGRNGKYMIKIMQRLGVRRLHQQYWKHCRIRISQT